MSADKLVKELADKARIAARTLVAADYKTRRNALLGIADAIIDYELEKDLIKFNFRELLSLQHF